LELELRRIYTRNPKTKKWFKDRPELFTSQAIDVIDDPTVEIVIEALGFQEPGDLPIFRDYILRAFKKGKSVVTSDKAVLARYGAEIWAAAQQSGQHLRFEACVGGGIPVIRSLHPVADGKERQTLCRSPQGSAAKRLCRNQSDGGRERQRCRSQINFIELGGLRP
jgi:homoserine dehydrogenase